MGMMRVSDATEERVRELTKLTGIPGTKIMAQAVDKYEADYLYDAAILADRRKHENIARLAN